MNKYAETTALADRVRKGIAIEDVIGQHVVLEPRGQDLVGVCPFKGCKPDMLAVAPHHRFFYCYGCHSSGNVIAFVMQLESRTYTDAVQRLAKRIPRAHLRLVRSKTSPGPDTGEKKQRDMPA